MPAIKATSVDSTAKTIGDNFTKAQNNLLTAYNLKEGASTKELETLAAALGVSPDKATVRSLQLIAEQRFQHSSQVLNMFSGLLDKVDQLKQRLIAKFSN